MEQQLTIRELRINELRKQIEILNLQIEEAENLLEFHLLFLKNCDCDPPFSTCNDEENCDYMEQE